ncbi:MAG: thiamine pyrophosphate-dependent enzyme [candidate division Zixibacteria bacterium]|nr:thiamine pyrophosphate-dependent enzyme [candidate division Zixibacteria bacterium]
MAFYEIKEWIKDLKFSAKEISSLEEYGGLDRDTLRKMYYTMVLARRIEQEEKILLRKGVCKFFIGCGGKELVDVIAAQALKPDDPFIGYYRNKAFDLYRGVSIRQKILEAIGDPRSESTGGMLQPAHSSYPELGIMPQASPTGSHAMEAAGLGDAIKNPLPIRGDISGLPGGRFKKDSVVFCAIGEGATSSPEFGRAVFYSTFAGTPNIFGIYNCGWAIATSVHEQFPDGNPTSCYIGMQKYGLKIEDFDGTDIKESILKFRAMTEYVRSGKGPAIANIRVVRMESHSGSDDQAHYMEPSEREYHIENDPLRKVARTFIEDGLFTPEELLAIFDDIDNEVRKVSTETVADLRPKTAADVLTKVYSYQKETAQEKWNKLISDKGSIRRDKYIEFHRKGFFDTDTLPENQPPMTMRKAINYSLFDLFLLSDDTLLFGEDVADFPIETFDKGPEVTDKLKGKGGVFLVTQDLQRAFGPKRVFNTPLDEAGILGRAVGHAFQGRIPFPEIQFIDYMSPGYQQLKDRIATAYQRSNARVRVPMIIRTSYGGYKQGAGAMWHSEANLGAFINIPGLHVAIPSNAADAAALLRTAFVCGDPVLFCEAVALYNRRDWEGYNILAKYPPLEKFLPFGQARIYNPEAKDLAIISYGITLPMSLRAAEILSQNGLNCRVIDLCTVKPIDWETIGEAVKECARVLIVSEDRFHGGVGPTISAYIADHLFDYLDAPVRLLTAQDCRVAYGLDGDSICLPQTENVVKVAKELALY